MAISRCPAVRVRVGRRGAGGGRPRTARSRNSVTQARAMSEPISRAPKRNDVGVVVLAGEAGGQRIANPRAAAGRFAIDGNRDADPGPADCNSALRLSRSYGAGETGAELRIIDALRAVGAEVDDLLASLSQPLGEFVLEEVAGMIGGEGDFHGFVSLAPAPRPRQPRRGLCVTLTAWNWGSFHFLHFVTLADRPGPNRRSGSVKA